MTGRGCGVAGSGEYVWGLVDHPSVLDTIAAIVNHTPALHHALIQAIMRIFQQLQGRPLQNDEAGALADYMMPPP